MTQEETARLRLLAEKYLKATISDSERAELETWFSQQHDEPFDIPSNFAENEDELERRIFSLIEVRTGHRPEVRKVLLWPRIAAAASILLCCSIGLYFYKSNKQKPASTTQIAKNDIAPGHNQATLTLANGQKILLTKGLKGKLAQQGNTNISVNSGNAIAYEASFSQTEPVTYNTLTTQKGEQSPYPLILSDGTQVWLNAASSITFPTAFNGKERSVTVTGEAYVIVAHDASHPFKVNAGGQTINDIGTEFDINAYTDEPAVTTTLASGSIKIDKGEKSAFLKPGQQAVVKVGTENITIGKADLEAVLAWKNGKFDFDNADVPTVMRQIARWYNVEVVYEGGIPNAAVNGGVFRNTTATNALKIIKLLGIPYRIEGRKIIITNTK